MQILKEKEIVVSKSIGRYISLTNKLYYSSHDIFQLHPMLLVPYIPFLMQVLKEKEIEISK